MPPLTTFESDSESSSGSDSEFGEWDGVIDSRFKGSSDSNDNDNDNNGGNNSGVGHSKGPQSNKMTALYRNTSEGQSASI